MTEDRLRYPGWRVVAACAVCVFFATVPLTTFAFFVKPLADQFAWSREAVSSAYGALTLVAAISAPVIGHLLDRFGARRVIVPCLILSGLMVISLSMTAAVWQLRVMFGIIGVATMGASPISYSRAIFGWFDSRRGRALGLMLAGAGVSGIVLPPVTQALIRGVGWRTAWLILGASTLVIAVPAAIAFIRDRPTAAKDRPAPSAGATMTLALRSRLFWTLLVVVFGTTVAGNGATVHMVALLTDRAIPAGQATLAASAMGAASLLGRLATGSLLDRFDAVRVSVVLLLIQAAGTFVLAQAHSAELGIGAAFCIGFGAGGEMDVTPYLLSRHFGMRSHSSLYGLTWSAWGVAGAAGPVLLGRAFDATGSYTLALTQLGVLTLGAAALMLTLRDERHSRDPSAA
jgi:MFS family permease